MIQWLYKRLPHLRQLRFPWRATTEIICGVLIVPLLVGLVWLGLEFELTKSDWAAWVQAIGSMGAIVGAWRIGSRQSQAAFRHALDLREIEQQERLRAIFPIATHAFELIGELADQPFETYYRKSYSATAFQSCLRAINAIPLHELGRYGLVEGYMSLQSALDDAKDAAIKRYKHGPNPEHSSYRDESSANIKRIRDIRKRAEEALAQIKLSQPLAPYVNYVATPTGELRAEK